MISRGIISPLAQAASSTTQALTWTTNPQPNSTIICYVSGDTGTPTSVIDNGTTPTTYTLDATNTGGAGAYIYRANNIKLPSSGSYVVTLTVATLMSIQLFGIEYFGVRPGPPMASNNSAATSTAVTTLAAVGEPNTLYCGVFSDRSGLNPETVTFNTTATCTEQKRNTNGATWWPFAGADGIIAAGGSVTMTWTLGDSIGWGASIAAYPPKRDPIVIDREPINRSYLW